MGFSSSKSSFLVGVLGVSTSLAVACGGGEGAGAGARAPGATLAPGASGSPAVAGTAAGAVAPGGPMKPIAASTMGEDLQKLGLDPKNLPPLTKMPPDQLRSVMKTFQKALGTKCDGCHEAGNFRAPTPKKKVATKMWDQFVRDMAMADGSVLYCDSCHAGRMEFLDTHDKKAVSAWMDENFVGKLKRHDAKDHSCETCHGEPFDPKFLAAWAK